MAEQCTIAASKQGLCDTSKKAGQPARASFDAQGIPTCRETGENKDLQKNEERVQGGWDDQPTMF